MITSASNPTLKLVRKLLAQKRKREELGLFAVEGEDLVAAASAAGIEPIELLVAGETVEPALLAAVSTLAHPARVVGVYRTAALPHEARETTLALWRVADPGNVGTLLRAADAFGAAVALSDGCADPLGSKALRASAGAIFRVPLLPFGEARRGARRPGRPRRAAPARARPRRTRHLRPRSRADRASPRARGPGGPRRDDRDEWCGRVAQRRRGRGDRAVRAIAAQLGRAGKEPAHGGRRCRRGDLVVAAEASVGDRIARLAELAHDGVAGACDREDAVTRAVRDEEARDPRCSPATIPPGENAITFGKRSPFETPSVSA